VRTGLTPPAFEARVLGFIGLGIVALGLVFCIPPIPQDQGYHAFADDRTMLGVPNFLNVASNLPFLVVGSLGLGLLLRPGAVGPNGPVLERAERGPLLVLFAGVLLTAFGSAYYHLAPDNARLVWDRLPMTVAFMGFFASMIGERVSVRAGAWLLWPLVWLGFVSVFKWYMGGPGSRHLPHGPRGERAHAETPGGRGGRLLAVPHGEAPPPGRDRGRRRVFGARPGAHGGDNALTLRQSE